MKTRNVSRWITVGAACLAIPFFFANLSSAAPPDYLIADRITESKAWRYTKSGAVTNERLVFVEPYGDYNDDGFADVLVGTKANWNETPPIKGYVRLLSGKDGAVLFSFDGEPDMDGQHAYAWPVAGNINNDGRPDVAIGVTYYDDEDAVPIEERVGSVLVFLTSGGQFGSGPGTTLTFDQADVEIEGDAHNFSNEKGQFGYNLALVDLDDNGYKDLVVGEWKHSDGTSWCDRAVGALYVYSSCELTAVSPDLSADTFHRIAIGDNCQNELSLCMDALGDGRVVMGAASWWEEVPGTDPVEWGIFGRVYVYSYDDKAPDCDVIMGGMFDKANFNEVFVDNPETDPLTTIVTTRPGCAVDCKGMNWPNSPLDQDFGHRTAPAGDFDNDGDLDLLVAARGRDQAWLMKYDVSTNTYIQHGVTYETAIPELFGADVGAIGDIDGDGYDDFAISEKNYSSGLGRVYVYSGRTAFFYNPTLQVPPIFTITGEGGLFGGRLGPVGDINHDGVPDLGIGARWYDTTDPDVDDAGAVYGFFTPTEFASTVTVVTGSWQSGTVDDELQASDDTYYVVRSGITKTVIDVDFDVPLAIGETIEFVGVTIESKFQAVTASIVRGEVFIRTGPAFSSIGTWTVSGPDTLEKFFEFPHTYVQNGQVTLRIEHQGIGLTFDSYYDKVTLVVSRTP